MSVLIIDKKADCLSSEELQLANTILAALRLQDQPVSRATLKKLYFALRCEATKIDASAVDAANDQQFRRVMEHLRSTDQIVIEDISQSRREQRLTARLTRPKERRTRRPSPGRQSEGCHRNGRAAGGRRAKRRSPLASRR